MSKALIAAAGAALAALSGAASAQEGDKLDCVVMSVQPDVRSALGQMMADGGNDASRDALVKELSVTADECMARQGIAAEQKAPYFDYSIARISREWLVSDIGRSGLATSIVDTALDFGPGRTNPDLSGALSEAQIMAIVQAYIDSGVDIEKIDAGVWEKIGAYAAATSIYWNRRKQLSF